MEFGDLKRRDFVSLPGAPVGAAVVQSKEDRCALPSIQDRVQLGALP
jgi:hypothetical protein